MLSRRLSRSKPGPMLSNWRLLVTSEAIVRQLACLDKLSGKLVTLQEVAERKPVEENVILLRVHPFSLASAEFVVCEFAPWNKMYCKISI